MAPESHRRPISAVNTSNNRKNIFNTLERKRIRLDHASYKKAKVNHIFIPLNKKCDSIDKYYDRNIMKLRAILILQQLIEMPR